MKNDHLKNEIEQIVIFQSGDDLFGIDLDRIERIIEKGEVFPVPDAPVFAHGLLALDNRVLPIISLSRLLGLNYDDNGYLLLVIISEGMEYGILSQHVHGIYSKDVLREGPVSDWDVNHPFIKDVMSFKSRRLVLLNVDADIASAVNRQ